MASSILGDDVVMSSIPKFTVKPDYILIEPNRLNLLEFFKILTPIFISKELSAKPRIWIIKGEITKKYYDSDLKKLRKYVQKHLKIFEINKKTAIVAESEYHRVLAEEYVKTTSDLPYIYKVFSSLSDAEKWVRE